jgi:hypothetical protein
MRMCSFLDGIWHFFVNVCTCETSLRFLVNDVHLLLMQA